MANFGEKGGRRKDPIVKRSCDCYHSYSALEYKSGLSAVEYCCLCGKRQPERALYNWEIARDFNEIAGEIRKAKDE